MQEKFDSVYNWEGFIRLVLQRLDIPTKDDIRNLHVRLDQIEQLIYAKQTGGKKQTAPDRKKRKSASSIVLDVIANHPKGANFKTIKAATGFDDKKIRNIIFRLDKTNKIQRVKRGSYTTT